MNTNIKVDFMTRTIIMTKRFYRMAQIPGTCEFEQLLRLQQELPEYVIKLAEVPRRNNKQLFPTYEDMQQFIRLNGEDGSEFCETVEQSHYYCWYYK